MIRYNRFLLSVHQSAVDALKMEWIPDVYYTLYPGADGASYAITNELADAVLPFVGEVVSDRLKLVIGSRVDDIVRSHVDRNEILIWVDLSGTPHVIESIEVVKAGNHSYRLAPYLDRTDIMTEVMASIEENTEK